MTNVRLNDMQLVLLATAAQREDDSLMPLPGTVGDQAERARKAVEQLIRKGLAEERQGVSSQSAWREDGDVFIGVVITDAGRLAINAERSGDDADTQDHGEASGEWGRTPASEPRPTKRSQLIALLKREGGASLDEMAAELGWLPHTTRAALTGLRKAGLTVEGEKVGGERRYHVAASEALA